jgi:hypothetical protein
MAIWDEEKGFGRGKADLSSCFAKAKKRVKDDGYSENRFGTGCCPLYLAGPMTEILPVEYPTGLRKQARDFYFSPCKKSVTPESSIQLRIKVSLKML